MLNDGAEPLLPVKVEPGFEQFEELGEEQQHHHCHGHVGDDDREIEQGVEHLATPELEALQGQGGQRAEHHRDDRGKQGHPD
ncbi:MAG: hypothetical protein J4G00_12025 [Actinomycetia bacterium]|nr:hypothetical protein [Actinomycetes bacterium]